MYSKILSATMFVLLGTFVLETTALGQGTAFTYQGRLTDGGSPANGGYDLRFSIYDAVTNGDQAGPTFTNAAATVSNGLFMVTLDFGAIFDGRNYWLVIAARTNGAGTFTTLNPRQPLLPSPYAIFSGAASNLLGTLPAGQVSGTLGAAQLPASVVTNGASGLNLTGSFAGNGSGLVGVFTTNLTSDVSILSIVRSTVAPAPSTNWTFHAMDQSSINFLTAGGPVDSGANGPGGYFAPLKIQSGGSGLPNFTTAKAMSETFRLDGSQFVFGMLGQGRIFSITVNGVDNFLTNSVPSDGNLYWFTVSFATAALRTITINNAYSFYGVYTPVTNGVFNGKSEQMHRMVVLGDSYTEQDYCPGSMCAGIVSQMQELLPQFDVWALGEGGTGFVNPGISGGTNFIGRIADVVAANPEYVLIYGGINDAGYATTTSLTNLIYVNATNLLFSLQARLPAASLAVVGPQWPRYAYPAGDAVVYNCATLLSNACAAAGVAYVNPIQEPWITGNVLNPNSGNANVYIRPEDGSHPTIPAGARYLANKIVAALGQFWNLNPQASFPSTGAIPVMTNAVPTPVPGKGYLWNSNDVLYWVTTSHTNYISGP